MASDRQRYNKACKLWNSLHSEQAYSVQPDEGVVAVIVANYPYFSNLHKNSSKECRRKARVFDAENEDIFSSEGQQLCIELGRRGIGTELLLDAAYNDVCSVIKDPEISDMVFIGNGSLNYVWLPGSRNDRFDWYDAAKVATHLKRGTVTQRHCGLLVRRLNVPLGTFIVSRASSVRAAYGTEFNPEDLYDPHNGIITNVYQTDTPPEYQTLIK